MMGFGSTFLVLITTTVILAWIWFKNRLNFWKRRGLESPPVTIPFGNMKEAVFLTNSFADRMLSVYKMLKSHGQKHGGMYFFWEPIYIPVDNEIVKSIMQSDFQHFVDRGIYINEKSDPLSAHLFSLEGKKWKLLRNKLSPTFTSGKLKMMFPTLIDVTEGLYKVMDSGIGKPIDIKDVSGRYTTDVIGSVAFGIECNSLNNPDSEFREKGRKLFIRNGWKNFKHIILFLMPKFMKLLDAKMISDDVTTFFRGVVEQTVDHREKNNVVRKDFMQLLIELKNRGKLIDDEKIVGGELTQDQNKITIDEIIAQAFIFFEAGFETSSSTMTFCLYELAKHKDIQAKARAEIERVLSEHGGKLTYEAAMDMRYLELVIDETLRKYPPLPSLNRICTKEYHVPGTDLIIEKGMRVGIPVFGIHYDPDFYPEPEKFIPERFTEENKKSRPAFTYLPFGDGPRICIGNRFGLMQTKVGLIALLSNYEFTVNNKTKDPIVFDPESVVISTKGGIWLDIKRISSDNKTLS